MFSMLKGDADVMDVVWDDAQWNVHYCIITITHAFGTVSPGRARAGLGARPIGPALAHRTVLAPRAYCRKWLIAIALSGEYFMFKLLYIHSNTYIHKG